MPENYSIERDYSLDALKVPPNSIQAEQSVLGGLMLDNQTWDSIADKVVETDFYRRSHQLIFRKIEELAEKQIPFDVITLSDALKAIDELDNVGGLPYLIMLGERYAQRSEYRCLRQYCQGSLGTAATDSYWHSNLGFRF